MFIPLSSPPRQEGMSANFITLQCNYSISKVAKKHLSYKFGKYFSIIRVPTFTRFKFKAFCPGFPDCRSKFSMSNKWRSLCMHGKKNWFDQAREVWIHFQTIHCKQLQYFFLQTITKTTKSKQFQLKKISYSCSTAEKVECDEKRKTTARPMQCN